MKMYGKRGPWLYKSAVNLPKSMAIRRNMFIIHCDGKMEFKFFLLICQFSHMCLWGTKQAPFYLKYVS